MGNKLIIAAAGSGKTNHLVSEALTITDGNVLITTFTEANRDEIKKKILKEKKCIPENITIQTWFSFLLQHGVRPYQSLLDESLASQRIGFYLVQGRSGLRYRNLAGQPIFWGESDFLKYYFTDDFKIYSDKISKFVFETNKKSKNEVVTRISRIYENIFIDEIQDLAGWDLEFLRLLLESNSKILMVGDPRQAVYETNDSPKNKKFKGGGIKEFLEEKCKKDSYEIDTTSLNKSHRNNTEICAFSSHLYPSFVEITPCDCDNCRNDPPPHKGVFIVRKEDVSSYIEIYRPQVLRYSNALAPELTFGISKGLSFDRVLIYPTTKIQAYLKDGDLSKISSVLAKFYVALTRARYSVGIICDYQDGDEFITGLLKYSLEPQETINP